MDWSMEDAAWTNHELKTFGFQSRPTVVIRKLECDKVSVEKVLRGKNDWENWFNDVWERTPNAIGENEFYVVLCSRAEPVFEDDEAPISYVSVTRDTWERLTRSFHIHRSITRSIARQVASFSSFYEDSEAAESEIHFTIRMSKYLRGDLALSLTYIPSTDSTFAVVYGCNEQQIQEIKKRIRSAGDKTKYPLLMIGIFAELERERLANVTDKLIDKFALLSARLDSGPWQPSKTMSTEDTQDYLMLCLQSRTIVDNIRPVRRKLFKIISEIDEFGQYFTSRKGEAQPDEVRKARRFKKEGVQMKKRLQDIIYEYDDKMEECNMIAGNTALAMQTVSSQIARHDSDLNTRIARANTDIALETRRENIQMRSIAVLTMVYLPFSTVAAIFSMNLFDWQAQDGRSVVSKYFWVFVAVAAGLTIITLLTWYFITYRHEKIANKDASEIQSKMA